MNKLLKIIIFGALLLILSNGKALASSVPAAPDDLEAEAYSSSRIDLIWSDNSSNETRFYIYRKTGSSGTYSQIASVSSNVEEYRDTDLDEDTKYYYTVRAYNSTGYSDYSDEAYATTDEDDNHSSSDLDAPDNLEAEAYSHSRIDLTWDDNSSGETRFYIYRKTGSSGSYSEIDRVSSNVEAYHDTDLDPNTKYYYKVRAYDGDDFSDYSNEAYAVTDEDESDSDLEAPDNLKAEAYSKSRVDLTWDDNSSSETKFYIYRRTGSSGSYSQIDSVSSNTEEYRDTDVDSDTKYYYKVRAYDGSSYSDYSNEDYATTDGEDDDSDSDLEAPDNLEAEVISSTKIKLTWDDNTSSETKFYIYRKTGSSGSYKQIDTVSSNTEKYTDSDLKSGTKYYYKVRAYDGDDYSDYSDEDSATTEGDSEDEIEAPSYLTAALNNGSVKLTWIDNADNEAAYVIERKGASDSYSELSWLGPNVTSYNDTTATGSTNYSYRVRAYNSGGYSDYSAVAAIQASSQSTSAKGKELRFTTGKKVYFCQGQQYNMDAAPININSRVMIPIRYVTDQLGANVVWDANAKKVTITYNGKTLELWSGKRTAKVNSVSKYIDTTNTKVTPVVVAPGRLMVPLRFVSENLGCQVNWEAATNTAVITLP